MNDKYNRKIKGITVDVYDVIKAFDVTCPALQHLIKKALCAGLRGHKNRTQDLQDIVDSALRAQCLDKDDAVQRQHEALIAESEQLAKGSGFKCGGFISSNYKARVGEVGPDPAWILKSDPRFMEVPHVADKADEWLSTSEMKDKFNLNDNGNAESSFNVAGDITINITINPEEVQHITGPTTEGINELIRDAIKTACKPGGVIHNR